jgi:hypothetical protein
MPRDPAGQEVDEGFCRLGEVSRVSDALRGRFGLACCNEMAAAVRLVGGREGGMNNGFIILPSCSFFRISRTSFLRKSNFPVRGAS